MRGAASVRIGAFAVALACPAGLRAQAARTDFPEVAYSAYVNWHSYSQEACLLRARDAVARARTTFALVDRRAAGVAGVIEAVDAGDTLAMIYCLADRDPDARVLVMIGVHTSRLGTDGLIRDLLQQCMTEAACGPVAELAPLPAPTLPPAVDVTPLLQRVAAAGDRLSDTAFAALYSDLSVLLAGFGQQVGWANGADAKAPPGDPVRGMSSRDPHHAFVITTARPEAVRVVEARISELGQRLPAPAAEELVRQADALLQRSGL